MFSDYSTCNSAVQETSQSVTRMLMVVWVGEKKVRKRYGSGGERKRDRERKMYKDIYTHSKRGKCVHLVWKYFLIEQRGKEKERFL